MHTIGFWGYSLASIAYITFILLLFAARNKSALAHWILVCTLSSLIANAIGAAQINLNFSLQWVLLADTVKLACWSILILSFNTEFQHIRTLFSFTVIKKYLVFWLTITLGCFAISTGFGASYKFIFLMFVVLNILNLVLLEQLFRSADAIVKRAVLPLVVALGGLAVFDFVIFAQATMVDIIDFNFWYARGYLATVAIPLLLITTRRIKEGSVRIFVSRHVVFYSSMLMIAGLYLLLMALAGYLINYFGGEWGSLVSIGFLVLSGIVLAVLLITESVRRQIKVFIAKNFFANKYEYRDEWLQLIGKIETSSAENHYQMATQIMMSKLEATAGAIVKSTSQEQFNVLYSEGITIDEGLNEDLVIVSQFCQQQGWIVDIEEYADAPSVYPSLFIQPNTFRARGISIIIPIYIGKVFYGLFILSTAKGKIGLNWEDRDLLSAVSKQLGNFVSLHEANDKIAESKQFDTFNRMSAFLVHDLKNVQAQLALITTNAEKHRDNPEFVDDVFETVESATERLAKVLAQLRNKQIAQSSKKSIELSQVLEKVIKQRNVNKPQVTLVNKENCEYVLDSETFFAVINHLIQNAQEATKECGWVKVSLSVQAKYVQIEIEDNGSGMSASFVKNRLFKPFDTTKGNAGMGIGVFEAKQFFESLAGNIKVESVEGQGTKMSLYLPLNSSNT